MSLLPFIIPLAGVEGSDHLCSFFQQSLHVYIGFHDENNLQMLTVIFQEQLSMYKMFKCKMDLK